MLVLKRKMFKVTNYFINFLQNEDDVSDYW